MLRTYNVQNLEFIMREHRNWLNRLMLTSLIAYLEYEMIEVATALNRQHSWLPNPRESLYSVNSA